MKSIVIIAALACISGMVPHPGPGQRAVPSPAVVTATPLDLSVAEARRQINAGPSTGPILAWVSVPAGVEDAGELVVIKLFMLELDGAEAAGFQAFITFDSSKLAFVTGSYTAEPFGLPILDPITPDGENIDLASGIDDNNGQLPTTDDSLLVELVFETLVPGCVTGLDFRAHNPPTRISDQGGNEIGPLTTIGLPDAAPDPDLNDDFVVNPFDLALLLGSWGPCVEPPSACCDADGFGGCLILDEAECASAGGSYLPGQSCDACPPASCGAAAGDCCAANGSVGCDDLNCCAAVCNADSDCCDIEWDAACAALAETLCVPCFPPPNNDQCADAVPIGDGNTPFDTTGATTDGDIHGSCEFDGQTYNDAWYHYTATCNGVLEVSTCGQADFDTALVFYSGCDCDTMTLFSCDDDTLGCSGSTSRLSGIVSNGSCYTVRVGGSFSNDFGTGTLTLTCGASLAPGGPASPFACPADLNCDGEVNAADLALLLGAWGPFVP